MRDVPAALAAAAPRLHDFSSLRQQRVSRRVNLLDAAPTPIWIALAGPIVTGAATIGGVLAAQWHIRRQAQSGRAHEVALKRVEWERADRTAAEERRRLAYVALLDAGEALLTHVTRHSQAALADDAFWSRAEQLLSTRNRIWLLAPRKVRRAVDQYVRAVLDLASGEPAEAERKVSVMRGAFLVYAREDLGISGESDELENALALERERRARTADDNKGAAAAKGE